MKVTPTALFMLALTAAAVLMITLTNKGGGYNGDQDPDLYHAPPSAALQPPPKRISRFLAANEPKPRNPNAADHCHKNKEVCFLAEPLVGRNATCCNNKCKDLYYDDQNCGKCKKKCLPFQSCCRGECVNLSYDKRHCGACNNPCHPGPKNSAAVCNYAMCDYA